MKKLFTPPLVIWNILIYNLDVVYNLQTLIMSIKPPCIKCELTDNSNGLFTCHGCRRNFCRNHSADHWNEIENRFEGIINEYNTISDIFLDYKKNSSDSNWEIIHKQAKGINEIKLQINEYQKNSNYSEQELDQLMIQLNKLKTELTNETHSFTLTSKGFGIYFATILIVLIAYYINSFFLLDPLIFTEINGPIKLSEDKKIAEHIGPDFVRGSFRIAQVYSKGIHHVRLSVERSSSSNIFIGITQSSKLISSPHGWFIKDDKREEYKIVEIIKKILSFFSNNQSKHDIKQNDTIDIEIDCVNAKIALEIIKQTNNKNERDINLEEFPLPWQIIIEFDHYEDRVRLQ